MKSEGGGNTSAPRLNKAVKKIKQPYFQSYEILL